jgi:sialic acid synthase
MVRDIRNTEYAIGVKDIFISDKVLSTRVKLERSIATLRDLAQGETIREADLHMLSPGDGFKWVDKDQIIGKKALKAIPANEIIYPQMLAQ